MCDQGISLSLDGGALPRNMDSCRPEVIHSKWRLGNKLTSRTWRTAIFEWRH
jgi:hypothetical protein